MPKPNQFKDLTGIRIGRLTAVKFLRSEMRGKRNCAVWLWRCICGNTVEAPKEYIAYRQHEPSCGCSYKQDPKVLAFKRRYNLIKKRHIKHGGTMDDIVSFHRYMELAQQPCAYCGNPGDQVLKREHQNENLGLVNGLDRIDSNLPYTDANVCSCCEACNKAKLDKPVDDFLNHIKQIYEFNFKDISNGETFQISQGN